MSGNSAGEKILLIGDIGKAFLDSASLSRYGCQVRSNVLDGIDMASSDRFDVIGVVMAGFTGSLQSALKALREANSEAKIILLAQMFEEPSAIEIVGAGCNGKAMADDYQICPVDMEGFCRPVIPEGSVVGEAANVDVAAESRLRQLEKLATTDELTGLKNRRYMWEFARQIIERVRDKNGRVTLLMFDIDDFKHYNDIYSHSAGDEILRQAAVLMKRSCRAHDVVGRIGGDEFAVIFWDDPAKMQGAQSERRSALAEHPHEAIFISQRFRRELNRAELNLLGPEGKGVLSISGGLASFPRDGKNIQELFEQADKALLEAKRSGKNRIYLVGALPGDISEIE